MVEMKNVGSRNSNVTHSTDVRPGDALSAVQSAKSRLEVQDRYEFKRPHLHFFTKTIDAAEVVQRVSRGEKVIICERRGADGIAATGVTLSNMEQLKRYITVEDPTATPTSPLERLGQLLDRVENASLEGGAFYSINAQGGATSSSNFYGGREYHYERLSPLAAAQCLENNKAIEIVREEVQHRVGAYGTRYVATKFNEKTAIYTADDVQRFLDSRGL